MIATFGLSPGSLLPTQTFLSVRLYFCTDSFFAVLGSSASDLPSASESDSGPSCEASLHVSDGISDSPLADGAKHDLLVIGCFVDLVMAGNADFPGLPCSHVGSIISQVSPRSRCCLPIRGLIFSPAQMIQHRFRAWIYLTHYSTSLLRPYLPSSNADELAIFWWKRDHRIAVTPCRWSRCTASAFEFHLGVVGNFVRCSLAFLT
jgi:hypothetical protein